ncbi:TIGR03503 family protein [Glaciecola sp. 2405UD65-10]|uniref:TIGR03503 family protein n=1 Tax=Glaciecola sp. 2405UD65-10 TaxID=3397244 RepID=UPI003B5D060C
MISIYKTVYLELGALFQKMHLKQCAIFSRPSAIFAEAGRSFLRTLYLSISFIFVLSAHSFAQTSAEIKDHVVPIGTEYLNSIKLLNNRFRVDEDVKEVTLIFFREYGSAPVVLVRPDGSKLFLEGDADDDSYTWFETDTYDMIALTNPMPGPWQAVGNILPESKVMVIADITLKAEPIPDLVFSGETLKQTAILQNAGEKIDMTQFRDVVSLSIEFVSTNNPNFPNFGLGTHAVANFEDNGTDFDEQNADGIFTGQFDLTITEGEWQPIFTVRTPLFSRQQINEKVILRPIPIKVTHTVEYDEEKDHLLTIAADPQYVTNSSLLIDGTVRHPSGERVRFSVTDVSDEEKNIEIINTEYGIYKVNMKVFARTLSGRDLVLTVPEYSFVTEPPPIVVEPVAEDESQEVLEEPVQLEEDDSPPVMLIISLNLILLVVGVLVLFLIANKRSNPEDHITKRLIVKIRSIKFKKSKTAEEDTKTSKD